MAANESRLILFSGLAADASVFAPQQCAFPNLVVPTWLEPLRKETLGSYCDRIVEITEASSDSIIGGASFGGIVALHVAQRIKPKAVILIGSVRSPNELPLMARLCRPLSQLTRMIPVRLLQFCCKPIASNLARKWFPHLSGLARQFIDSNPAVFKWSLARILDWNVAPIVDCPIFHIHGKRDFVLPVRYTRPDVVVKGGGHVISLTHPDEVNAFIGETIARTMGEQSNGPESPIWS